MKEILQKIMSDPRYQKNLDWGKVRRGHPEATVRAHIAELEKNLATLKNKMSEEEYWKIKLLIHTHDSFKAESVQGVPITHPQSHASLARKFLSEFCSDSDLLNMVQYHDEGYALWQQVQRDGSYHEKRMQSLLNTIKDWELFLKFSIVDACTKGKGREPINWFIAEVGRRIKTTITSEWILP
jgi:hypothetical protein